MTKLAVFSFGNHEIRTVTDEHGEAWFVANDVCAALELMNPHDALAKHVDQEDLAKRDTLTPGGLQKLNHVNESGLYALIFGSRKESAKRFKRWVTSEVLPAIRKDGYYATNENLQKRTPASFPFRTQWYHCPSRPLEEDMRKVELLAQFAGLSRTDKLSLLVKTVVQHDEYFATVIATARDWVRILDSAKDAPDAKDSPEAIGHNLSAR